MDQTSGLGSRHECGLGLERLRLRACPLPLFGIRRTMPRPRSVGVGGMRSSSATAFRLDFSFLFSCASVKSRRLRGTARPLPVYESSTVSSGMRWRDEGDTSRTGVLDSFSASMPAERSSKKSMSSSWGEGVVRKYAKGLASISSSEMSPSCRWRMVGGQESLLFTSLNAPLKGILICFGNDSVCLMSMKVSPAQRPVPRPWQTWGVEDQADRRLKYTAWE